MILNQLIEPRNIVVVGASNNVMKPGGKVLKNIIDGEYKGGLYGMNPKEDEVQGIKCFKTPDALPDDMDLAIISIPSRFVPGTVKYLAENKGTKAFLVLSAGFSETNEQGKALEKELLSIVEEKKCCLIGPNCMGVLNTSYQGSFAGPIPKLDTKGVDFVSGSGATAAFIMEAGIEMGLKFASMYSVGNSAQNGVEEILQYWDETYDPKTSSNVKLLYMEKLDNPTVFLKHASSLISKGCKIAAIKAGSSDAGSRAASSHTGAMATSDEAVSALFKKAGVIRCFGREELMLTAAIFSHKPLNGNRIAIITHAGGPGVMLADTLNSNGFEIPPLEGKKADELLTKLYPGSSVSNPIDFLATGTADQLGIIIDAIDNDFDYIDGMVVIFGSPGLTDVKPVYNVLNEKMNTAKKPILPILPSIVTAKDAVAYFKSLGRINFSDEVLFGRALTNINNTPAPSEINPNLPDIDIDEVRAVINNSVSGYLPQERAAQLLDAAGIKRAKEAIVDNSELALSVVDEVGYPIVMKAVGPLHKTDVGGVSLNIMSDTKLRSEFERLMSIEGTHSIMVQPQLSGTELFIGAKYEPGFGHTILCGLGGIYIEVFKDVASALSPVGHNEALKMIESLKSVKLFNGVRGLPPINKDDFASILSRVSALLKTAPEIVEMDLNPLLAGKDHITAVDVRIRVEI